MTNTVTIDWPVRIVVCGKRSADDLACVDMPGHNGPCMNGISMALPPAYRTRYWWPGEKSTENYFELLKGPADAPEG